MINFRSSCVQSQHSPTFYLRLSISGTACNVYCFFIHVIVVSVPLLPLFLVFRVPSFQSPPVLRASKAELINISSTTFILRYYINSPPRCCCCCSTSSTVSDVPCSVSSALPLVPHGLVQSGAYTSSCFLFLLNLAFSSCFNCFPHFVRLARVWRRSRS